MLKKLKKFRLHFPIRIKAGLWFWSMLLIMSLFALPLMANLSITQWRKYQHPNSIAPFFTPQVQHWGNDIERWASAYSLEPNLLATIMQIESCGHPTVSSWAGAQGLFQVMPFHFAEGESMLDPDTNALRSAMFIRDCTNYANGDVGLILACYNGGPSVTWRSFDQWAAETKRYYVWGLGIYMDSTHNLPESETLEQWLLAGGVNLCNRASVALGMR